VSEFPQYPPTPPVHTTPPEHDGSDDSIKDRATDAAQSAKQGAADVAQTATEKARDVAAEGSRQARDLVEEARGQVTAQARAQQQSLVSSLRSLSDELSTMSQHGEGGLGTDIACQARDQVANLADWLDRREPGDLLTEARTFARRRPGAFLLGAAVAGLAAGRLTRGVVDAQRDGGDGTGGGSGAPRGAQHAYPAEMQNRPTRSWPAQPGTGHPGGYSVPPDRPAPAGDRPLPGYGPVTTHGGQ